MNLILAIFLISNIFLIGSIQSQHISTDSETSKYYSSEDQSYVWGLINNFTGPSSFGGTLAMYKDILVAGSFNIEQVAVFRYNGSKYVLEQNLSGPSGSSFGSSVSVYEDTLVISAWNVNKVFIYQYNGSYWNLGEIFNGSLAEGYGFKVSVWKNFLMVSAIGVGKICFYRYDEISWINEQNLTNPLSQVLGWSNSIYENVTVFGDHRRSISIFRYNGTSWNLEEYIYKELINSFGDSVSLYGDVLVVGAPDPGEVLIYRYNGTFWNNEQNFTTQLASDFGKSLSLYEDAFAVGNMITGNVTMFRYNGSIWNFEQNFTLFGSYSSFGYSVATYGNFTAITSWNNKTVFVYQHIQIPQVNTLNCSSLFSSFDCYWDKIEFFRTLKYQINYGFDWIDIDSPILKDGNVYYQQFNSSIYDNITGNEYYSIQIKACDSETMKCGEGSSPLMNLTTRIDGVKNFQLSIPTNYSINVSWSHPNVELDSGIPNLDHYNLSYFKQIQPDLISSVSLDNSSTSYLFSNLYCGTDYNISIYGCRTELCQGEDKGEVVVVSIFTPFEEVQNLACSISYSLDIICNWNQPINCSTPFYYNFTYQSISQSDSGNYQPTSLNQQFTAQIANQDYQINVSACNSNGNCGDISTFSIKTDNLTSAPTIHETISKIEEIELNFTKVSNANNYSISLNNGTNWQNFTTLDLSGDNVIGTINGIGGNVQYNISVRGCSDLNCETPYLGDPSSISSIKAKLGSITSLSCYSLINGFVCNWDSLIISSGLEAYSFNYNSIPVCVHHQTPYCSISSGLNPGTNYQISVSQSADPNCLFNEYSGMNSTTSITPLSPCEPTQKTDNSSSNTTAITVGVIVPIAVIAIIIIGFIVFKKRRKNKIIKQIYNEKELRVESDTIIKPIQFKFEYENENENENENKQISSTYYSIITLFKNGKAIEYLFADFAFQNNQNPSKIQIEENIQKKGEDINSDKFINISSLIKDTNDRIIQDIVSGRNSIYLLTSNQNVYGIGSNQFGQLVLDSETLNETEKPILMMKNVSKIFSGNTSFSVFVLNSNQELFGCGYNHYGQVGLGESIKEEAKIQEITQIQNIPKGKIIDIKCGFYHSVMLIEDKNENPKRKLYSCGYCQYNGLGKEYGKHTYEFTEIKSSLFENDNNILDFSVGQYHTLILSSNKKLIGFGSNTFGQFGNEDEQIIEEIPIQIELPKLRFNEELFNYHISCGYDNSFLYYSSFCSFSNLEEDLIKLFRRKEFCNISFKTENGEIIEAHKLILKYRLNQNQNQIEKLKEIISKKSIKESNQIFEMIYSNNSKINPILYSEIKEIINSNEKIEETMKRIYLNEKDFIIERKEKQYKFPKLILIMRSELYRGMFLSVTEDKSNKVTDYSELSNKSFQLFEYWIYSNQIKNEIEVTKEIINEIKTKIKIKN
ncbi:hypothetical protein M0811_00954 [Anaeramoeba ignava]|uniref:Fibronectin type-III domain-containing protein n=1 Tax=Anaeramoeba ignava TaxID=1746090 RepID=A0A9Q0LM67_ANAIG|nr:hypothetical protein M0811_00954 [Anaeramoeba ignava]